MGGRTGFSVEATDWLLRHRNPVGTPVDTVSLDLGNSTTSDLHVGSVGADCYGVDNLTGLVRHREALRCSSVRSHGRSVRASPADSSPSEDRRTPRIPPGILWALDFQFDVTIDGRTIQLLNVIDEFTRECPAIVVARSIDADAVVALLERLTRQRGAPGFVRFDNGPEFIAHAVADWCRFNDVDTVFIDPGSPWQNAWIESFNGRLRDELLNSWQFDSLLEAQVIIEDWRIDYNEHRPHTAHGDLTPSEFAQAWTIKQPEAA